MRTRGTLRPDPDMDPILALFYFIHNDWPSQDQIHVQGTNTCLGVIAVDGTFEPQGPLKETTDANPAGAKVKYLDGCGVSPDVTVSYVASEIELLDKLVFLVRETDPDIIMGYEVTMLSWGYCIDRAAHLNINLTSKLSRIPSELFYILYLRVSSTGFYTYKCPPILFYFLITLTCSQKLKIDVSN